MLLNLHVKNMALIRELDIDFGRGLNILTGETGAGKSILIGSINAALGMQGFKGFTDGESALVELVFSVEDEQLEKRIEELDVVPEDGQIILSRRLSGGRSISKINGETVPVSKVKELASLLIDIHGQHEHQSLLYRKNHLRILDEYAKEELAPFKAKGQELYGTYLQLKKKMEASLLDETARKKEMDFLAFEVEEISDAGLRPGEDEELETKYRRMANARKIAESAQEAYSLTGGSSGHSASDMVSVAAQRLMGVSGYDPELEPLCGQLSEIEALLGDLNRELSVYLDELVFDEYEFAQIEERLNLINHLKTKYGRTIEDVLAYQEEKEARIRELEDYDAYLARLTGELSHFRKLLEENANRMTGIRKGYAEKLGALIRNELVDLNFLETQFEIALDRTDDITADGADEACFMICMNPGSPKKPLGDVASGGELSRIMLAIKTVLADKEQTDTLIFDEIDVGISGRTAQKVSEKMAVIAGSRQVLCITHLAQIASMADHHFYIEKSVRDQSTETTIRELDRQESEEELARILGGAEITEITRQSAKEMKAMAEQARRARMRDRKE